MELIPVLCPCCGGPAEIPDNANKFFCNHCGTQIIASNSDLSNIGVLQVKRADFDIQAGVLKGYHGESVHVVIPNTVKKIEKSCFNNLMIEKIIISNTVREIEPEAFSGCNQLKEVELSTGLECIKEYAFKECYGLKKIVIPESVIEIEKGAFNRCYSLEEVIIKGNGLKIIGNGAFCGCKSLRKIELSDSINLISKNAFWSCHSLTEIILPETLTEISEGMFRECKSLKKINIPSQCHTVREYAFCDCLSLEELELPEGLVHIENYALNGCSNLKKLELPNSTLNAGNLILGIEKDLEEIRFKSDKQMEQWFDWLVTLESLMRVYAGGVLVDYFYLDKNFRVSLHYHILSYNCKIYSPWRKTLIKYKQDMDRKEFEKKQAEEVNLENKKRERIVKKHCPECDVMLKYAKVFDKSEMICPNCGMAIKYVKSTK